jgi:hypothetical protein
LSESRLSESTLSLTCSAEASSKMSSDISTTSKLSSFVSSFSISTVEVSSVMDCSSERLFESVSRLPSRSNKSSSAAIDSTTEAS